MPGRGGINRQNIREFSDRELLSTWLIFSGVGFAILTPGYFDMRRKGLFGWWEILWLGFGTFWLLCVNLLFASEWLRRRRGGKIEKPPAL